ncbi:hypothetical protein D3C78_1448120 [compost metagenome]
MAGFQAAERHRTRLVEAPDDLPGLARLQRHRVGFLVAHAGVLHHHVVVRLQVRIGAQHQLVADLSRIAHVDAHGLARLDLDAVGREAHGVGHVDIDGARGAGGVARLADGGRGGRHGHAVAGVLARGLRGAGNQQGQRGGLGKADQGVFHESPQEG